MELRNPIAVLSMGCIAVLFIVTWMAFNSANTNHEKHKALADNKRQWFTYKPQSYRYRYSAGCMLWQSFNVEVSPAGTIVLPVGEFSAPENVAIENLFEEVSRALAEAYFVEIKYHPYFGFPLSIEVDWDKDVIDDECYVEVTAFVSLDDANKSYQQ